MSEKNLLSVAFASAFLLVAGCDGGPGDDFAGREDDQQETQTADTWGEEDAATQDTMVAEDQQMQAGMGEEHVVAGTVTNIDEQSNEVTLDHDPVESLNWPAMVMPFQVSDEQLLEELEVGERVSVVVAERGDGQYVIQDVRSGRGGQSGAQQ